MSSLFSKIAKGEIGAYKVAENDDYLAFLDIFPLQKGHTLVIPKKETDYIFDLEDEEFNDLMLFTKEVAIKIKKVIPCNRIGVTVIGLEVPHAHVHLIPISKEKDMNFSNSKLKFSEEEFEFTAKMIREA